MSINDDKSQRICGELRVSLPLIGSKVEICADNCDDFTKLIYECEHKVTGAALSRLKNIVSKILTAPKKF